MNYKTPAYVFDTDTFIKTVSHIKDMIGNRPLTYSMKANPVLIKYIPDNLSYIEVCSHGEFNICRDYRIDGRRIIYSGLVKNENEVRDALEYGVGLITAESVNQLRMINNISKSKGIVSDVLIRLSSGNQFGVSLDDLFLMMDEMERNNAICIRGIHYYSGTQKKRIDLFKRDLDNIDFAVTLLRDRFNYVCELIEYGPGIAVEYFKDDRESILDESVQMLCDAIGVYDWKDKIGFEFGRVLAADCGEYITKVCDIKTTNNVNYLIVDGGIHQLKYFGQNMAMQIPPLTVSSKEVTRDKYCICGSLCTVSDVLVREIDLPVMKVGDKLTFLCCGAYSSTESPALFLSREFANIYIVSNERSFAIRENVSSSKINSNVKEEDNG